MKSKKYVIYICGLLLLASFAMATDLNVQCSPTSVEPSRQVTCDLVLSAAENINSIEFAVSIPAGFSIADPDNDLSGPRNFVCVFNPANGRAACAKAAPSSVTTIVTVVLTAGNSGTGQLGVTDLVLKSNNVALPTITVRSSSTITIQAANPCVPNPCPSGKTCVANFATNTYTCTPPDCTSLDWSSSDGACQSNNKLTRTWTKTNDGCSGGVTHPATELVTCNYQAPPCSSSDWTYDGVSWGTCSLTCGSGTQARTQVRIAGVNCDGGATAQTESQNCNTQACTTTIGQQIGAQIDTIAREENALTNGQPTPSGWTTSFISRLAALFKSLWG